MPLSGAVFSVSWGPTPFVVKSTSILVYVAGLLLTPSIHPRSQDRVRPYCRPNSRWVVRVIRE